jgi:hypothetical protein
VIVNGKVVKSAKHRNREAKNACVERFLPFSQRSPASLYARREWASIQSDVRSDDFVVLGRSELARSGRDIGERIRGQRPDIASAD